MKKIISIFCMILFSAFAFGQTVSISGSTTACAGSTFTLTGNVSTGLQAGDSLIWVQQVNGVGLVTIARIMYPTNPNTITVPRDPSFPATIVPAAVGTYRYYLYVKRNNVPLPPVPTTILITVYAAPTIGSVTFSSPCSDGNMMVTVDGLSGPFPVNVKIYDDGILPANLVNTQSVSSTSTSFPIHYWSTNGDNSNLYLKVENPSTGCSTWK